SSNGRDGSFASDQRGQRLRRTSAVPPIATELMHRNQLTDVPEPHSCSAAYDVAGSAYSINSPAIASSVGGTVSASASAVPALTIGSTLVGCVKDKPASPRAQRIYFAFNSRSKMLLSASTAARHSGRSHAGFLGCSQQ